MKFQTLVISLPGSERRQHINKTLSNSNVPFYFIDGCLIQNEDDAIKEFNIHGMNPTFDLVAQEGIGTLGCSLAFIRAFAHIITNNIQTALVLEDDAVPLHSDWVDRVDEYLDESYVAENPFDYLYMHGNTRFGNQAQLVTNNGARILYQHKNYLMFEPMDFAVRNLPLRYQTPFKVQHCSEQLFCHKFMFNDISTSERLRINARKFNFKQQ